VIDFIDAKLTLPIIVEIHKLDFEKILSGFTYLLILEL
jgi:hypothetical protein